MKRTLWILSAGLFLTGLGAGADFWDKKPYTQWTDKEARKILLSSPWTYEYKWGYIGSIAQNVTGQGDSEREFLTIIRVHLFSAHTLRQAYAAIAARQNPKGAEELKRFADREFKDDIIVSWTLDSVPKGASSVFDIERTLRSLSLSDLKNTTYLATNLGKKVYLKDYLPPPADGTGAKFIFPRFVEPGVPFLTPDDKTLRFQTIQFEIKQKLAQDGSEDWSQTDRFINNQRTIHEKELNIDATWRVKDLRLNNRLDF